MKYLLNITPEELLNKKLYVDFSDEFYKFYENDKNYILNYEDNEIILVFTKRVYGWELNCKINSYGTNSDRFYTGGVVLNFIGQMIDQKIIKFDNEIK